jgi:putative glycosyltransferase (TIGR04372 family)
MLNFINKQISDIKQQGVNILIYKINILISLFYKFFIYSPFYIIAIPLVLILRILRPFLLIRIGCLISSRIGHFAGNTELYLCEKDFKINVPNCNHIDIFYFGYRQICNKFLAKKISDLLLIFPKIILEPVINLNKFIPGWEKFEIGQNTEHDRDVHNLLDKCNIHFSFTNDEILRGDLELENLGIPFGSKIVCLFVRDNEYLLKNFGPGYEYHNYRDCNIYNYLNAANDLTKLGYYVVRMGALVKEKLITNNTMIIDYAKSGKRSDFLDIYFAYKCDFVISSSSGWDSVPSHLFRKPILFTNVVPIGLLLTFSKNFMLTTRKYFDIKNQKVLKFSEVYNNGHSFYLKNQEYLNANLKLIENTPEEISNAVSDMVKFVSNKLILTDNENNLQNLFWETFEKYIINSEYNLHGELKALMSPSFLSNNKNLID